MKKTGDFVFELGKESDDTYLRALLAKNAMPGGIKVAFHSEPDYRSYLGIQGKHNQVIAVKEKGSGRIVGFGTRSIKPAYVNGNIENIGYLSNLRSEEEYRCGSLLVRGYRYLAELHKDGRVPFYISTIIEENNYAKDILTSNRCGLPVYEDRGLYFTNAIIIGRGKKESDIEITRGSAERIGDILGCLNRNGKMKQFYPYYDKADFVSGSGYLKGICAEDFYIATEGHKIVGVAAKWDQSGFRQLVIEGYSAGMVVLRFVYNSLAPIFKFSKLPPRGLPLKMLYVGFIAVDNNEPGIFRAILRTIYNDAVSTGYQCILVGMHSSDPLREVMREYAHFKYLSRLYVVRWGSEADNEVKIDGRIPYLEIGAL
ncbi:MAG: hypothetical protein PHC68_07585 [Syntrophorhabdaceae bacterium]|nr:hypothetical protein [Syntrophorhabdaceae bacterium]